LASSIACVPLCQRTTIAVVGIESTSALASMQSRRNQLAQQWTGSELWIVKVLVQHFERIQNRVESDEIGGLQRSHLVTETRAEDSIDVFSSCYLVLQQKDRFVHGKH